MEAWGARQLLISILMSSFVLMTPAGAQQKSSARPPIEKAGSAAYFIIRKPVSTWSSISRFQMTLARNHSWNLTTWSSVKPL